MIHLLFGHPFGLLDCIGVVAIGVVISVVVTLGLEHRRSVRRRT